MLECFPSRVAEELERPFEDIDELISAVNVEIEFSNKKLENRMFSIEKSRLLLDRLNESVSILRNKPDNGELLYQLVYNTYITPNRLSIEKVCEKLNIAQSTYYTHRKQALTIISLRLWAVPSSTVESWFELVSLLELM